ncbi:MAG: IclR family transcriptional regulator [Marmoricola sp.]
MSATDDLRHGPVHTDVGVLDKCVAVLFAVRAGVPNVAEVANHTGIARPTVHRLAAALEQHGLLGRVGDSDLALGPSVRLLAAATAGETMVAAAGPFLAELRDRTGETAQLYRRVGEVRVCVGVADGVAALRDSVMVGDALPMTAGSSAQVLLAWADPPDRRLVARAKFSSDDLAAVRRRGWAQSAGQREQGLASVSAPVWHHETLLGSLCAAGPVARLGSRPARRLGPAVSEIARDLGERVAAVIGS